MTKKKLTVAKRPCGSCPYRKDVPSGVWAAHEYDKLEAYDGEIWEQVLRGALGRFDCHQRDGHLCAGWVACHGPHNLVALRMQAGKVHRDVWSYQTDVPVWGSGAEAKAHGMAQYEKPPAEASRLQQKLLKLGVKFDDE